MDPTPLTPLACSFCGKTAVCVAGPDVNICVDCARLVCAVFGLRIEPEPEPDADAGQPAKPEGSPPPASEPR